MLSTKICPKCETEKSVEEFYKNRRKLDGLNTYCKSCYANYYLDWYKKNTIKHKANMRKYKENYHPKKFVCVEKTRILTEKCTRKIKKCNKCGEIKPLQREYFSECPSMPEWHPDRFYSICKECKKEYRDKTREHKMNEMWRQENIKVGNEYFDAIIYKRLYAQQSGNCLLCGKHKNNVFDIQPGKRDHNASLLPDHDHITGQFRGLVCHLCNRALGFINDSKMIARNMVKYLEKSSSMHVPLGDFIRAS